MRAYRQVTANDDQESDAARTALESRSLSWYHDDDGCLVIKGRLPAEMGGVFLAALAAMTEPARPEHREARSAEGVSGETDRAPPQSPDPRPSADQRRADALVYMAESALATGPAPVPSATR